MNTVCINNQPLEVKEWNGRRVVSFKDIDRVHQRKDGTARRNFKANRKHFIANVDYFLVKREDDSNGRNSSIEQNGLTKALSSMPEKGQKDPFNIPPKGLTLLTETGYLMLVKSLTDDLAWKVQRELVNNYFRASEPV